MHNLTKNFECWITKDGKYFTLHNVQNNSVDSGYGLGEYAKFVDEGTNYLVTINSDSSSEIGTVDLRIENKE